jgi:hypothetical protein
VKRKFGLATQPPLRIDYCVRNRAGKQLKMNDFAKKLWPGDPPNTCNEAVSLTSLVINAKYYYFFNQFNVLYHYSHMLLQPTTHTSPTHQSDYPPIHLGCCIPSSWWVLIFIISLLLVWSIFCLKLLWQCLKYIVLICFFERERKTVYVYVSGQTGQMILTH